MYSGRAYRIVSCPKRQNSWAQGKVLIPTGQNLAQECGAISAITRTVGDRRKVIHEFSAIPAFHPCQKNLPFIPSFCPAIPHPRRSFLHTRYASAVRRQRPRLREPTSGPSGSWSTSGLPVIREPSRQDLRPPSPPKPPAPPKKADDQLTR